MASSQPPHSVLTESSLCVFQERLKASEHRADLEDKAEKRNADPKPCPSSLSSHSPSPVLHPCKPPLPSRSSTPSSSSITPLLSLPTPVTTLKSEEGGQKALSHSQITPLPHPPSPRSASPPPSSPRRPKQEVTDEGEEPRREEKGRLKPASGSFQGLYSGECETFYLCILNSDWLRPSCSLQDHRSTHSVMFSSF